MFRNLPSFDALSLENARVLVRVDLGGPLVDGDDGVADDPVLRAVVPTLERVVAGGARLIIAGSRAAATPDASPPSIEPIAARLAAHTGWEVHVPEECVGDVARKVVADLRAGQVCCLENLLTDPGETGGDEAFSRELARLADAYVLESLSLAHRDWSSLTRLPRLLRQRAVGPALAAELELLSRLMLEPARPFVAIVAGPSFEAALPIIGALRSRADAFCFAGGVGHTLLAATEADLGFTPVEPAAFARARTLLDQLRQAGQDVLLPTDLVAVRDVEAPEGEAVSVRGVPSGAMGVDLGPDTIDRFRNRCRGGGTVLWIGDVGRSASPAAGSGGRLLATSLAVTGAFTVLAGEAVARAARSAGQAVAARLTLVTEAEATVMAALLGRRLPALEALG